MIENFLSSKSKVKLNLIPTVIKLKLSIIAGVENFNLDYDSVLETITILAVY